MAPKTERFEMRLDEAALTRVDAWRSQQLDIPSRSEAMRRLIELGLGQAGGSNFAVQFSDGEKLILLALRDLQKGLKLKDGETDLDLVASTIIGGHYWAPKWEMSGVFHNHADNEEDLKFVVDVLDMWTFIEESYAGLSAAGKAQVAAESPFGKHVKFTGFDGNNEAELVSIGRFMVNDLERFTGFKGRDMNSHCPTRDRYAAMLELFKPMRSSLVGTLLSPEKVITLLNVR